VFEELSECIIAGRWKLLPKPITKRTGDENKSNIRYCLNLTEICVIKFYNAMVIIKYWKPLSLCAFQMRQQRC